MNRLRLASYAMTVLGVALALAAGLTSMGAAWLLAGILLAWAGLVKIVVVLIWTRVARLGTDRHMPEHSV